MDLPSIGAHCALESCNINDFLPIRCRCDKVFCKDHSPPDAHSCTLLLMQKTAAVHTSSEHKLQKCAADKCNKPSLEAFIADGSDTVGRTPAICERCKESFCATHRAPASHSCTAPDPAQPASRNEAAKAILAQIFLAKPSTSSKAAESPSAVSTKRTPPSNPKKAAQLRQVELMKMRHRAKPADPKDENQHVAIDQRLHVKVALKTKSDEERLFWFQKTMGAGKALDILASRFNISSDTAPLYLCKLTNEQAGEVVLENDKLLVDQIEDGSQLILRH